ncbi:hypothetical protein GLYMA_01G058900v4 [Glycine max]|uniref:Uncharacterized protein n=1 Tax=Glycine max TaxID=3847 RepID=K7K232_SOYBN|nr:hypothetical protein JHK85_000601 [Glycine max]KAH1161814.1 hypothetical protein GYH30_000613 [Glycine max]KRH75047.1 hypothetical protein GLYMA_01G058900v4 [Glycine max]
MSHDSAAKLSKKLSAINIVEELFEEGSTMLSKFYSYNLLLKNLFSFLFTNYKILMTVSCILFSLSEPPFLSPQGSCN